MILEQLNDLLKDREFLHVATASLDSEPNAAPKFLLKFEKPYIYLVDSSHTMTIKNLRKNPRASVSFMDMDDLEGYRLNGTATLIEKGPRYAAIGKELAKRQHNLTVTRVIEGSRSGKKYSHFELEMPEHFIAIRFKVEEAVRIAARGDLYRERGASL